jgi:RNA polymerase sigma-70 factor (ECF subfamily)
VAAAISCPQNQQTDAEPIAENDLTLPDANTHERGHMAASRGVTMNQRDLVERAGRGDHDAFAVLVRGSIARLEAVARLILRDPELARDAVQEVYLRAWRDLPGLRDPDRLDAWLHRLTVNACLDVARRRRRRAIEVELSPMTSHSVADSTGLVLDRDQLERGFRGLTTDLRAILVLHYYVGMTMPVVAETLDLPLGTAQSRLARGLALMRDTLGADAESEQGALRKGGLA